MVIRSPETLFPNDPHGQELPEASGEGGEAAAAPASGANARGSPVGSFAEPPAAIAARGSQNTVTTPRIVSKINVPATTVEVRSARAVGVLAAALAPARLPFGDSLIGRQYKHIMRSTRSLPLFLFTVGALTLGLAGSALAAKAAVPKFYFHMGDVKAGSEVDAALKTYAAEAVQADLAARPEWASDVGTTDPEALDAELKKRNLRGFQVVVRFESLKKELKDPTPGSRRKRLSVSVRLSVFGTTIPEAKLAFSGEGEAGVEAEVADKAVEAEGTELAKDAIKDAVKQAVDQAVMKLPAGKAGKKTGKKK